MSARRAEGGSARIPHPRFSIVTASFNQAKFLEATLQSIRDQGRSDVEHLVLDGGSTDGSVEILREHEASLAYWVSAPDGGQPAAWNEGLRRSRGEILGFINSDDLLLPGGLDEIARLADANPHAEWLIGGTTYFGEGSGNLSYSGLAPKRASDVLYFETYTPQPGQFVRRSLVERVGEFDESLQFAFDLEYFVRCALSGARAAATPRVVAAFRFHGESKTMASRDRQDAETRAVEDRWWGEILRREGLRARYARQRFHGRLALGEVRSAGRGSHAWQLLGRAAFHYPTMIPTRAFIGTVQRLLGLRAD